MQSQEFKLHTPVIKQVNTTHFGLTEVSLFKSLGSTSIRNSSTNVPADTFMNKDTNHNVKLPKGKWAFAIRSNVIPVNTNGMPSILFYKITPNFKFYLNGIECNDTPQPTIFVLHEAGKPNGYLSYDTRIEIPEDNMLFNLKALPKIDNIEYTVVSTTAKPIISNNKFFSIDLVDFNFTGVKIADVE